MTKTIKITRHHRIVITRNNDGKVVKMEIEVQQIDTSIKWIN